MNNTPNSTPMKPPRGHHSKSSKETGILMTVIKTLSSTVSNDHRDHEKTKLDKEYKQSDARLDGLIAQKQGSLNDVMSVSCCLFLRWLALLNCVLKVISIVFCRLSATCVLKSAWRRIEYSRSSLIFRNVKCSYIAKGKNWKHFG